MTSSEKEDIYDAIFEMVRLVPKGRVTSYGAIAAAIGMKSGARVVGYAMKSGVGVKPKVPAHRVVNSKGLLTGKHHFGNNGEMQQLLEKEKIKIENDQVMDFKRIFWDPAVELGI